MNSAARYHVPNLERGLQILELLLQHPAGLQQAEIASGLGLAKTSVYRISMTLVEYGYLERDVETKALRLTRKLAEMGSRLLAEEDLLALSREVMGALRDEVKETVLIGSLIEAQLVVLGQVLGSHHFKFSVDLGTRLPLHASAPGKAVLAWLPAPERARMLRKISFTRFNERTITGVQHLIQELERIRRTGYAVDQGEQMSGIHCVAAPVLDRHGYPVASLWTTGPHDRLRRSDFAAVGERMAQSAGELSTRLGYPAARLEADGGK